MNHELRHVYDAVSSGRLSQDEALERIRSIKEEQGPSIEPALLIPAWERRDVAAAVTPGDAGYAEHHAIVCELPGVDVGALESLLPKSHCCALDAARHLDIAHRYREYALACFERLQTILRGQSRGRVLLQVVVAGG